MGAFGFFITLILQVVNIAGLIMLTGKIQLITAAAALVLMIVCLTALLSNSRWAWPITTIVFSLALANTAYLIQSRGLSLTTTIMLFSAVLGTVTGIIAIETEPEPKLEKLETYKSNGEEKIKGKKSRPKKQAA